MTNLKESAEAYKTVETKIISDLDIVLVEMDLKEEMFNKGTPEEFTIQYITVNDEKYRVPISVIKQLKVILENKPELESFKVIKKGEGMNTTYTVITD